MGYVVGIDGGGTRTRAVAVDAAGEICARAQGGCGNFQMTGLEGMERLLRKLLEGMELPQPPCVLCLALAGAGRSEEQEAIVRRVRARGWAREVEVVSDAMGALEGAHGGGAGLIAIAGTGSMVLGKNARGECVRAGGWGPLLGDEGSGYHLATEALRVVFRARDGWGERTELDPRLRAALGLSAWDQIVRKVYGGELGRQALAALSPHVFAAARAGDGVALDLVEAAGAALGAQVGAVARRLGMAGEARLACVGGVFAEREMLWPALVRAARPEVERLVLREPLLAPVMGAVLLAWRRVGRPVEEAWIRSLAKSAPEFDRSPRQRAGEI